MYKYVAVDFDGTILRPDHDVSERTVDVLKRLQAAGIKVLLCSGRNVSQMNFVAERIGTDNYQTFIISDNGGVVTLVDNGKREMIRDVEFTEEEVEGICQLTDRRTSSMLLFEDGVRYLNRFNLHEVLLGYFRFGEKPKFGRPKTASKILLTDKVEKIDKIYDEVKADILEQFPHINVFRSVPRLIELTPNGSTKGAGLEIAFEKMGWDLSELIAFGDGENDISMFEVAGHGVAMGNGFDTVKAVADEVCMTNAEDGVAQYLENYFAELLENTTK